jgi:surface antigen
LEETGLFSLFAALSLSATMADEVPPHVECVPIARQVSGIAIYGDALTWWDQAERRFARGNAPRKGAVLAFKPHGAMLLGHVAAVSKIVDHRTILVTHANWSMIDGRRGQIERNVRVVDVSDEGDWSRVRVWYAPLGDLGTTAWPVHGFIYPDRAPATKAPKLEYAVTPKADPFPTGRLAYLGKRLAQLK